MAYENCENRSQVQFLPNSNNIVLPIPPNLSILRGNLILTGTVTIADGTTNGAVVGDGGPQNLIKRVRIIANPASGSAFPGGWIVDCSGRSLLHYAQMQRGKYVGEQSGSVLGNGAAGTYLIYLSIPIYFADDNLRANVATALYAGLDAYSSLQVQVQTGGATDCFSGTDRTWTYNLLLQWDDKRVDITPPATTVALFQESHVVPIFGANARLVDQQLPQDGAFLQWLVMAEQNQPGYELSDAILQRLTIQGPTYSFDEYPQDIRQRMYDDSWIDPSQNAAGLYMMDMTEGVIQNANPAAQLVPWFNVLNPSGPGLDQLSVYTRRVYTVQQGS